MKQQVLSSASSHTRITNLIASKLRGAVSIFSYSPTVEVEPKTSYYQTIVVKNEHTHMITFAELDCVRGILDEYCKKYKGMFYTMQTRPYLSKDGSIWLHMPVIEIKIRRYDFDYENKMFV